MRNADLALYRAKGDGRGTFRFFEPEMDAQMQARRAMEYDLRRALAGDEFELHYQPIVNLASNEISGVRGPHPLAASRARHGVTRPRSSPRGGDRLHRPLGEWVLSEACSAAARWPDHTKIRVNLSPVQFRSPGLVQVVIGALALRAARRSGWSWRSPKPCCWRTPRRRWLSCISCADSACALRWTTSARVFLAQLSAELSLRPDQDRPLLRQGHRRRHRLAQHRAGRGGAGEGHRDGRDGGRRRDTRTIGMR